MVSWKQSLPTAPGNSLCSKTIRRDYGQRGRSLWLNYIQHSQDMFQATTVLSSLPLLSASFSSLFSSPPLPFSLIPLPVSPPPPPKTAHQHRPDYALHALLSSIAPMVICTQIGHTNSSSVLCIYTQPPFLKKTLSYFKRSIIMSLILPLVVTRGFS